MVSFQTVLSDLEAFSYTMRRRATELEEIAEENALLSKTVESLQLQVDRLSHDLGRGEYNPDTTRILALADNPSTKDLAIRTETLERLREENKALLEKVVELEQGGASGAVVPLATLEGLQKENEGLKGDVALALKKNDRLRQVRLSQTTDSLLIVQLG